MQTALVASMLGLPLIDRINKRAIIIEPHPLKRLSRVWRAGPAAIMSAINEKPLDARLAAWLVHPLKATFVTPSQLTTVRLITGLASAYAFAQGPALFVEAAWLFVLSHFLDHTDGELARISGKSSRFGHYYDLVADAVVMICLFAALGYGLRGSSLGELAPWLGLVAGAAVSLTFWLHLRTSERQGGRAYVPKTVLFEAEDVLYLLPLVMLMDWGYGFLLAAAIGAPAFGLLLFLMYRGWIGSGSTARS